MQTFDDFKREVAAIVFYEKVSPYIGNGWNPHAGFKLNGMRFPYSSGWCLHCDYHNVYLQSFLNRYQDEFESCRNIEEKNALLEYAIDSLWKYCLDIIMASHEFGG